MIVFRRIGRLIKISTVLARYRLDDILAATRWFKPVRIIRFVARKPEIADLPLGARIRLALEELGPIFVKFGQILSTRRDLLPPHIADELAVLQDQVKPFDTPLARAQIEQALGAPIDALFARFEDTALASASIAQVHAAELPDGREVVVKVLRPGIQAQVESDVALIRTLAELAERYWPPGKQFRPTKIVREFEKTILAELDLTREAANASQLRRNFEDSDDLYVPEVHWPLTRPGAMVMERVYGVPVLDLKTLRAAGVDLPSIAERGLEVFYTQVFRDNFFHADMHPGNILVDISDPANASFIALDFGIMGSLPPAHAEYMAGNFAAFFDLDYRRVAELHIEAGWVPADTRVDELEGAVRAVCEPQLAKPLSEISFGEVLFGLIEVAREFNLILQPELVMLQKTLLNVEGVARELHPDLDVWATAKPVLTRILRDKHGIDAAATKLKNRFPIWFSQTPEMPGLIYGLIKRAEAGDLKVRVEPPDWQHAISGQRERDNRLVQTIGGTGLAVVGALLAAFADQSVVKYWVGIGLTVVGVVTIISNLLDARR